MRSAGDMMPSYLTGAFRLVAVLRGELLIYHHYYLNIPGSLNYTRIKLGLSFSCNFSLFFFPLPPSFNKPYTEPCRPTRRAGSCSCQFVSTIPRGTHPSAATAESVRSLYIVHSTEPVIMIGLSPGRQVRGWAS